MALRQATGFVERLPQLTGLDWKVPDFSTLCRRQKTLVVDIASRRSSEPHPARYKASGTRTVETVERISSPTSH